MKRMYWKTLIAALVCCPGVTKSYAQATNVFDAKHYGAQGDGKTLDTKAINAAIEACAKSGGGTVLFPGGSTYLTGSIHLRSNIVYKIEKDAIIKGAPNGINAYDPPEPNEWSAYQDFGHSHYHNSLLWGENLEKVTFTGGGEINGGGISRSTVPAGDGNKAFAIKQGSHILFKDITITQGGHFAIILNNCKNVTIEQVTIKTTRDGIDLMSCSDVVIRNSTIRSERFNNGDLEGGDDAIGIKSDYALGKKINSNNILIENCILASAGANAIQFGSETVGNFKNVTVRNVVIERAEKAGLGITSVDGAVIENVSFQHIQMSKTATPFYLLVSDRGRSPEKPKTGKIKNIQFENITANDCYGYVKKQVNTAAITGLPGYTIDNITFRNVTVTYKEGGSKEEGGIEPPYPTDYSPRSLGKRPASGFYIRHARNIRFENLVINFEKPDHRPAFVLNDVQTIRLVNSTVQVFDENDINIVATAVSGLYQAPAGRFKVQAR